MRELNGEETVNARLHHHVPAVRRHKAGCRYPDAVRVGKQPVESEVASRIGDGPLQSALLTVDQRNRRTHLHNTCVVLNLALDRTQQFDLGCRHNLGAQHNGNQRQAFLREHRSYGRTSTRISWPYFTEN